MKKATNKNELGCNASERLVLKKDIPGTAAGGATGGAAADGVAEGVADGASADACTRAAAVAVS